MEREREKEKESKRELKYCRCWDWKRIGEIETRGLDSSKGCVELDVPLSDWSVKHQSQEKVKCPYTPS